MIAASQRGLDIAQGRAFTFILGNFPCLRYCTRSKAVKLLYSGGVMFKHVQYVPSFDDIKQNQTSLLC